MVNYESKAIVYFMTNRCGAGCDFCGRSENDVEELPIDSVLRTIDQAYQAGIRDVDFTGGEALLRYDDIITCLKKVKSNKMRAGITTNSSYANDAETGYRVASELKEAGLTGFGFSLDYEHQESIPYSNVLNAVKGALQADVKDIGIQSTVKKGTVHKTNDLILRIVKDLGGKFDKKYSHIINVGERFVEYHAIAVNRAGRANSLDRREFPRLCRINDEQKCDADDMTITNRGEIVPCCSFYSCSNGNYSIGNVNDIEIETALKRVNHSVTDIMLSPFFSSRIITFLQKSEDKDAKRLLNKKYTLFCEFCNDLRSTPSVIDPVIEEFNSYGKLPEFNFKEGKTGVKVDVIVDGREIDIFDYIGPVSSRDFWTGLLGYKLELLDKKGDPENKRKELEESLERAKVLPKVEL